MSVKELDSLRLQLADGTLLGRDAFQKNMALLLPNVTPEAISTWADFAQECVDMGQYVDFIEEPGPTALSRWFDTTLAGFVNLSEQYSRETAAQVCELGLNRCVLYPYELGRAAEEVQKGSDTKTIFNLMLEGKLEAPAPVFPKLQDVLQDEPQQKKNLEMSF